MHGEGWEHLHPQHHHRSTGKGKGEGDRCTSEGLGASQDFNAGAGSMMGTSVAWSNSLQWCLCSQQWAGKHGAKPLLGTSESQLLTAVTKISVCLLFIPPSPAEPTQREERSWSLFLALQGREWESLCCPLHRVGGYGVPSRHGPPGAWPDPNGASRQEGLHPNRNKVLLWGQGAVGKTAGGRDVSVSLSASLQDSASLESSCNAGGFGRSPCSHKAAFLPGHGGELGGPQVTAPIVSRDGRGVKRSKLRVTAGPMLCGDWTCFAQPQP